MIIKDYLVRACRNYLVNELDGKDVLILGLSENDSGFVIRWRHSSPHGLGVFEDGDFVERDRLYKYIDPPYACIYLRIGHI